MKNYEEQEEYKCEETYLNMEYGPKNGYTRLVEYD